MSVTSFSEKDVLYAFSMEPSQSHDMLKKYLQDYPQYAAELIDLSYELSRELDEDRPLSDEDRALIDSALAKYYEVLDAST